MNVPDTPATAGTELLWEGDHTFNIYIYDYCKKRGYNKSAHEFQIEAGIPKEKKPPIDAEQGLLFEWWSVFWLLFTAKSNPAQSTEDAVIYQQYSAINQPRNRQASTSAGTMAMQGRPIPGTYPPDMNGMPQVGGPPPPAPTPKQQESPRQPQQPQQPGQMMQQQPQQQPQQRPMMNGVMTNGIHPTGPPNGPSSGLPGPYGAQPQQVNGMGMPTGQPMPPQGIMNVNPQGPYANMPRGPQVPMNPGQRPMAPGGPQPGFAQVPQPGVYPPRAGNPPNAPSPLNPNAHQQQPQQAHQPHPQQQGQPQYGQNPGHGQLQRAPTPRSASITHPSPSMGNRQPPQQMPQQPPQQMQQQPPMDDSMRQLGEMDQLINGLRGMPPQTIQQVMANAGLHGRDMENLQWEEKQRLCVQIKNIMGAPGQQRKPNGPGISPPNAQNRGSMQPPASVPTPRGTKRNSSSPSADNDVLPSGSKVNESPRQAKRNKPSPNVKQEGSPGVFPGGGNPIPLPSANMGQQQPQQQPQMNGVQRPMSTGQVNAMPMSMSNPIPMTMQPQPPMAHLQPNTQMMMQPGHVGPGGTPYYRNLGPGPGPQAGKPPGPQNGGQQQDQYGMMQQGQAQQQRNMAPGQKPGMPPPPNTPQALGNVKNDGQQGSQSAGATPRNNPSPAMKDVPAQSSSAPPNTAGTSPNAPSNSSTGTQGTNTTAPTTTGPPTPATFSVPGPEPAMIGLRPATTAPIMENGIVGGSTIAPGDLFPMDFSLDGLDNTFFNQSNDFDISQWLNGGDQ